MEQWKKCKIRDIVEVNAAQYTSKDNWEKALYLDTGNITENKIDEMQEFDCSSLPSRARRKVKHGDIIFSTVRPNQKHYGYITNPVPNLLVSTGFAVISVNQELANSKFIYYWLSQDEIVEYLHNIAEQSVSAYPSIKASDICNLEIKLPPLEYQSKVASILSTLENKISLNHRINGNLEQQAQALFKAWFVDFEPFKDGKFVDSELGRIPEGWKVGQLDELVEIKYGKDHKKLLPGNIPVYGSGGIMRHVNMPIYEKESVLIPRKGSLNNVLYVNHPFWTVDTMFYTRMKINGIAKFIYLFISPIDLLSMNNGSAVPSMTTEILSKIRLVIPSKNIFDNFESLVAPSFDKIGSCNKEICKLSNLRDTLLPKLLSGELSINTITE